MLTRAHPLVVRPAARRAEPPGVPPRRPPREARAARGAPHEVADRATLCRTLDMFPIECVVRGYLTGGGWKEYQRRAPSAASPLPAGLSNGDRLPEPIYTPAWKAPMGEHDENISYERTVELVGRGRRPSSCASLSLEIFARAAAIAEGRGLILADTKFEFGADRDTGIVTLADEVLTSDSSPILGCRGVRDRRDARAAHGELRQADRARLARRELGPGRVRGPPTLPHEIVDADRRPLPRAARAADDRAPDALTRRSPSRPCRRPR